MSKWKCPVGTVPKEEINLLKINDAIKAFQFKHGQMSSKTELHFLLEHGHLVADLWFNSCCTRDQDTG